MNNEPQPLPVPKVLPISTPELFQAAVRACVRLLSEGEVVALPTETVYGLAANAWDPEAVEKIYKIKERPARNPVIVHIVGFGMARACVSEWPERAANLARSFWPGPLTMVLPKSSKVPAIVTAGGTTVALRWPSHPFTQAVIEACGFPLAAPSANRSNQISPTTAEHVVASLENRIPLVIDAGPCSVGIESTVVDLCTDPPVVLRPGMIPAGAIGAISLRSEDPTPEAALASPGMLSKHYAPKAALLLGSWSNESELRALVRRTHPAATRVHIIAYENIPMTEQFSRVSVIPNDPEAFARALYAELHTCDRENADLIVVEEPPATEIWAGVTDRLRRAAGRPSTPSN